jgi:outer membrane receptor protein involved in Fe transport
VSSGTEPLFNRSLIALAVIAAIANAQAVHAQQVAAASDSPLLEEVTVTGTSIKRGDDAALPVTIVSQEAMELRDAATPVDLLTAMPAVVNVPINDSNQGGVSARGDIASVNLRGIGSGNTLVLLNGRRVAAHGISSTEDGVPAMSVNVNTLPTRGLERVDILRDGASAVYGSDAVAGVINFVTDSSYVGNELQVQTGITEIGSGSDYGLTITHGNFAFDDRLHWISTFDYLNREELKTSDLPNAGDSDKRSVSVPGFDAANGPFFDRNASSAFPSFRIGAAPATRYLTPMEGGVVGIKNSAPNRTGAELGYYYDVNADGYSVPETERFNWFNALDFKINDKVAAFGHLALYRAESTMVRPPVAYGINSDAPLVVSADNPYNPYGSRFFSPTGAPNADGSARLTGAPQAVTILSKRFTDIGAETIDVETTSITATAGLRGDIAPGWTWESAAVYSRAHTEDDSLNAVRESALLAQTLRSDASAYNPFGYNFAIQNGQVLPTTPYVNPADATAPFVQRFHQEGTNILGSIDARINGELWDLGGGPIAIAVGAEHRWDDYELTRPQFAGKNGVNNLGLDPEGNDYVQASAAGDVIGDRTVVAAFAETVVPIVGSGNAIPGIQRLQFGASMRYEEYSDFGSTSNPKFTMDWRPIEPLMIRASYNEGFRAPNLSVMNYPTRFVVGSSFDPYRGPVTGLPVDGQFQRQTAIQGNQDLVPETSEGRTLGFVLDVPGVDSLRVSVDYWKIDQENLIASPIAEEIRANDASMLLAATQAALASGVPIDQIDLGSGTGGYAGDPLIGRSATITAEDRALFAAYNAGRPQSQWVAPVGVLLVTSTPYSNLATATIEGYDFNVTYSSPHFDWGRLGVTADATYLSKFERQAGPNAPLETRLGKGGATKWRGSLNISWSKDDVWSAGLSAYYIGSYADTSASLSAAGYEALNHPNYVFPIDGVYFWRVEDSVTFNGFGAYTFAPDGESWFSDLNVRVGVKNLTNEDAPLTTDPAGYDSSVYNSVAMGRVWTLRLTKNF